MPISTLAALLFVAAPPLAQRWLDIGRDETRTDSLDLASIEGAGTRRTAWTRTQYSEPRDGEVMTDLFHNEYDCAARTFTLIAWRRLDASGAEVEGGMVPQDELRADAIVPDTIGADELAIICGEAPAGAAPIVA